MRHRTLIILWLALAIGTSTSYLYSSCSPTGRLHRKSVEDTMRNLGGLAPFPQSARDIRVESHWFSNKASFSAPPEDIERWIKESPGLQSLTGERIDNGTRVRYEQITGNRSVELIVDEATNRVDVNLRSDAL